MKISTSSRFKIFWFNILFFFITVGSGFSQVVINELVSSNSGGVADEDGDSPDWVEFYNAGSEAVDLTGYGVSDDPEDLFKWEMPEVIVEPGSYHLIFASDKDRKGYTAFWETIIRENDETQYLIPTSIVSNSWVDIDFDDESWESGPFGIGFGDGDDATEVPPGTISVFSRTSFTVSDPENISRMLLHIDFDDGYVAYLNGEEVSRQNMNGVAPLAYNATASTFIEPILAKGGELESISLDDYKNLLQPGENILAIQVHNFDSGSSDLSIIPFLTLAYTNPTDNSRGVAVETKLEAVEVAYPHTNFKISSSGETVFLTSPEGSVVDQAAVPELLAGESYGRNGEAENGWGIFTSPSPMEENTGEFYQARTAVPSLSQSGGFYSSGIEVALGSDLGGDVYYTTNGSIPTTSSQVLLSPVSISETTTFRLRAIEQDKLPSEVVTETFIIDRTHDLPVVSVVTEPDNLWSDESGIYVQGTNGITGNCSNGPVNWNQDWEIPIHLELFDEEGNRAFGENAGARMFGGCSRTQPQKSLAILFRGEYGIPNLEYRLFKEKEIETFESIVLRNSGNDFNNTQFRDALMKTLVEGLELDYQAYQPVVVYMNGEYWGIQNIREKINEHFIASNHDVDTDDLDLIENNGEAKHGGTEAYSEFMNALQNANMQTQADYEEVAEQVELDSYIDYMVAETFFSNTDWPGNNLRYWRERKSGAQWRWIIYDTDFGFSMYGQNYEQNMLQFATDPNGPDWPNPPWSTYMFRKFLENDSFKHEFINRYADLLNSSFNAPNINSVIDSLSAQIENEMATHQQRWGGSIDNWNNNVQVLRDFADRRGGFVESHITSFFGVGERNIVRVSVSGNEQGVVRVNRLQPSSYPWNGKYFQDVPIKITAIPKAGYKFVGWTGDVSSPERTIEVQSNQTPSVTAQFEVSTTNNTNVVINEIMYNGEDENDPQDWVELYNKSLTEINIGGWVLKDEDDTHEFEFPANTILSGGGHLVITQSKADFEAVYSSLSLGESLLGDMGFGLAGGSDQVRIFDQSGVLIDQVEYDDEAPWPEEADGTGFTLELKSADSDNALPESWAVSTAYGGTPGSQNGVSVANEKDDDLPSGVSLSQNYPNPFNPVTTIKFELAENANIRLSIVDVIGREVSVLKEGFLKAGAYSEVWNASSFSSGIYMYRLDVNGTSYTRKMILTK